MSKDLESLASFSGTARLFPLPNVVLFPHVTLPLHIFEARYRQMTADALAGDRLIAMVLLRPGFEASYEGRPPLYSTACIGRIVAEQTLADGRFNILLRGLSRARLLGEVHDDKLYRLAEVELLQDIDIRDPFTERSLRAQLRQLGSSWFKAAGAAEEETEQLLTGDLPLSILSDVLSFAFALDREVQQELLEELDVEKRIHRLLAVLVDGPKAKDGPEPRSFPPGFSPN